MSKLSKSEVSFFIDSEALYRILCLECYEFGHTESEDEDGVYFEGRLCYIGDSITCMNCGEAITVGGEE